MLAEPSAPAAMPEKPRLVFAFGPNPDSFFIGCGTQMEWHDLPPDLDQILTNRAREVLALSLGDDDAFYCRYITNAAKPEDKTVTGNLPPRLEWLVNSWWADQYQVPHIALGPGQSYFFQLPSMTTWEHLPKRLEETLLSLRDTDSFSMPRGAVTLGAAGSHILLCGASGSTAHFAGVDSELAEKLAAMAGAGVEAAILSAYAREDYVVVFKDGRIFYSLPPRILPVFERFVRIYQDALAAWRAPCEQQRGEPPVPPVEEEDDIARLAARLETTPISSPESVPQVPYTPVGALGLEGAPRAGRGARRKQRGVRAGALWEAAAAGYCVDPRCDCRRGPPPGYAPVPQFYR